jgi:uroporphyrin-III C-methyltransferase/precorrin-2 dehydrogenase/sirohydrochlorin ferrochelatase
MPRILYPLSLDLHGRPVLVAGGGPVAARKLAELLRCGADITVVASVAGPAVERLASAITLVRRPFRPGDEAGRILVFACTDDPAVNREIAALCAARNIPCNVSDTAAEGTFHVPGVLRKGAVTVTVSTGGSVPGLTRYLKRILSEAIGDEVADLAALVGRFRAGLRTAPGPVGEKSREILEGLPYRKLLDLLREKGPAAAEAHLARLVELAGAQASGPDSAAAGTDAASGTAPASGSVMPGQVTLVGAGPGNPKLLTLAAAEAIRTAEVIVHDRLIPEETLNLAGPDCLLIPAGKRGHSGGHGGQAESMRQEDIEARLVEHALAGRRVVRLKGGDPFVFGRGYEEILALEAHGIPWSLVPGISSVTAGPAWAGIPLTHRGVARSFAVMSGMAYSATNTAVPKADTILLLMGLQRLAEIVPAFLAQGWSPGTPVAAIQDATLPDQRVCLATLATIADETARRGFDSPTLLVIGEVVRLAKRP